jgi:hypothetical protein
MAETENAIERWQQWLKWIDIDENTHERELQRFEIENKPSLPRTWRLPTI